MKKKSAKAQPRTLLLYPSGKDITAEHPECAPFTKSNYTANYYVWEKGEMQLELVAFTPNKEQRMRAAQLIGESIKDGEMLCFIKLYRRYPNGFCFAVCDPYAFPLVRYSRSAVIERVKSFTGQPFEDIAIFG